MNDTYETRYDNDGNELRIPEPPMFTTNPVMVDDGSILEQIRLITADNAHISEALRSLDMIDTKGVDGTGAGKAHAISNVVQAREATNQQMLRLLEKMYDHQHKDASIDVTKNGSTDMLNRFEKLCESLTRFQDSGGDYPEEVLEILKDASKRIFA